MTQGQAGHPLRDITQETINGWMLIIPLKYNWKNVVCAKFSEPLVYLFLMNGTESIWLRNILNFKWHLQKHRLDWTDRSNLNALAKHWILAHCTTEKQEKTGGAHEIN